MSTPGLLVAIAGLAVTGGLLAVVAGLVPTPPGITGQPRRRLTRRHTDSGVRWRAAVATAAGMLAWVVTSWPVTALIAVATVLGLPGLMLTSRTATRGIDRVEAVGEWTRRLADILVVGVGLEQAIIASRRTAPDAIRDDVAALAARLSARWPVETTLRAFADDLHDPTADMVAAALILGQRRRGPGLARVLTGLADTVAEEVAMRRRVEADRAKPRTTARAVTVITLAVAGLLAANGTYLAPYASPLGQLVLAGITAGFVAALAWMRALTLGKRPVRLLASPVSSEARP